MKGKESKTKLFIVSVMILSISIILYFSSKENSKIRYVSNIYSVIITPFQELNLYIRNIYNNNTLYMKNAEEIAKENEALKKKIDKLEKDNRELTEYRQKIKELREAFNIKDQFSQFDFVGANVIAKEPGNWFDTFTIDLGQKDGVKLNDPVITSKGLVGRVSYVDIFSSKVVSIIDGDSSVSARISKTRDLVLVKGDVTLKNDGLCKLDYIPNEVDLDIGDVIESSGFGGVFPKGFIIGRVIQVKQSNSEIKKYSVIQPVVDFRRLEEVIVLKSKL